MFDIFSSGFAFYFWLMIAGACGFVVGSMWASFFQENDYQDALLELEVANNRIAELESKP